MNPRLQRLTQNLARGNATQLGIGPMSVECVEAAIEIANREQTPLMLVASRRQIECKTLGGGYVNHWDTAAFANFVRQRDHGSFVLLCRDHGGPFQGSDENHLPFDQALQRARESFYADIEAGFDILHVDTCLVPPHSGTDAIDCLLDLYLDCCQRANTLGREIAFEVGDEEQSGSAQDLDRLRNLLDTINAFCSENNLPPPIFTVGQTGTLVMEAENVGAVTSSFRVNSQMPVELLIPKTIEICEQRHIHLKQHNTDYLSTDQLRWHPRIGIHASNVAPEFGVIQTRATLQALLELELPQQREQFIQISYDSRKWEKWMKPNTTASDFDRSIIAGHYCFSQPEVQAILIDLQKAGQSRGIDPAAAIRSQLSHAILRYTRAYRLTS